MSTILVTGAGGFAGVRIAATLAAAGHEVVALLRSGAVPALLAHRSNVRVLRADLTEPPVFDLAPDLVVHAAARSRPGCPAERQVLDNAIATANIARFAAESGAQGLIYLSSLSIHGRITASVVDAATPRQDPCPYGMTKYLGECVLADLAANLPSVSLRLPGIVGPGAHGPWLSRLVAAALRGESLTITNAEAGFNNLVHVDDLAEFIAALAVGPSWIGAAAGPLGAGAPISVRALAELVAAEAGAGSAIVDAGARGVPFTISSAWAAALGYRPAPVDEIVRRYVREVLTFRDTNSLSHRPLA